MANRFSANALLLSKQIVTATGNNLYVNGLLVGSGTFYPITNPSGYITGFDSGSYILRSESGQFASITQLDSLSGYSNNTFATQANLTQTGLQIQLTGQAAVNYTNSVGSVLSGNMTQTGVQARVYSNFLASGLSGTITQTGLRIQLTGQAAVNYTNSVGSTISGNLTQTGVQARVYSNFLASGLSGHANSIGNTISGNLTQTGLQIQLTGQVAVNYTNSVGSIISGNLTQTGVDIRVYSNFLASGLSGTITQTGLQIQLTGQAAINYINSVGSILSGDATQSGIQLRIYTDFIASGLSGTITQTGLQIQLTGQAAINYVNSVGSIISGNLTQTGVEARVYSNFLASGLSGTLTQTGVQLGNTIASTGNQAWEAANNNGINLSGNLTQTGVQLGAKIDSLSGYVNNLPQGGGAPQDVVYKSGDQTITGIKSFVTTGINLQGNPFLTGLIPGANTSVINNGDGTFTINSAASTGGGGGILGSVVYTSGTQTITGVKSFITDTYFSGNVNGGSGSFGSNSFTHAEGEITKASGRFSHSEGFSTVTVAEYSHAEGYETVTSGNVSHAEGYRTKAFGVSSHAEGGSTLAFNTYSHAEGTNTLALGYGSHAEGNTTITDRDYSHAQGKYNRTGVSGLFQVGRGSFLGGRIDVIYISDTGSNPSILSGNWLTETGFFIAGKRPITGAYGAMVNNDGTLTISGSELTGQAAVNYTNSVGSIISGNLTATGAALLPKVNSQGYGTLQRSIYLESPTSGDRHICILNAERNYVPTRIVAVADGSSPQIGWRLLSTSDRSSTTGLQIATGFCTSTTTGNLYTSFINGITGNNFLLFKTDFTGGSLYNFSLTLNYY